MTDLRPLKENEFESFIEEIIPEYARENVESGRRTEAEALDTARQGLPLLLSQGIHTPNHHLYIMEDQGKRVGLVWLHAEMHGPVKRGFIFQIMVDEAFRGKGYGKQAMQLIEDKAYEMEWEQIGLNVFSANSIARSLYENSGFRTTSINMVKDLPPR